MAGFVKLFRSIEQWEWYTDVNTTKIFLHCLIKASRNDYRWKGMDLKKGQFPTSYEKLAKENGLSVSQVRTSIKKLILTGELTKTVTDEKTVINVVNWDLYQGWNSDNDKVNDKDDDIGIAGESQGNDKGVATTKKERKKELKENNINDFNTTVIEWFESFWTMYPKHVQKRTAEQKFKLYVTNEEIYFAIMNDLKIKTKSFDWTKDNGQFVPNPTTYLNQRRWEDEKPNVKKSSGSRIFDLMGETYE